MAIAEDKQASDILLLDLRQVSLIADYFVVCSAASDRQITAIQDEIVARLDREADLTPQHVEGDPSSGWVLLDYGGVIAHIFSPAQRDYYRLEELWSAAQPLVRIH